MSLTLAGTGPLTLPSGTVLSASPATGERSSMVATMQKFADEFLALKASSGYQKLPSGLIIQWFPITTTVFSNGFNFATFPMAFPVAGLAVVASSSAIGSGVFGCEIFSLTQVRFTNSHTSAQSGTAIAIGY